MKIWNIKIVSLIWVLVASNAYAAASGVSLSYAQRGKKSQKQAMKIPQEGWDFVVQEGKYGWPDEVLDPQDPMCDEIKNYMNVVARKWVKSDYGVVNFCAHAVRNAPMFTEPPWQNLAPASHIELISKLLRLRAEGSRAYFSGVRKSPQLDDEYYRRQAQEYVSEGGLLQYWRTRFADIVYDPTERVEKAEQSGIQHVIQLRQAHEYIDSSGSGCHLPNWKGAAFMVNEFLTEPVFMPDENMSKSALLLYQGDPVLDSTELDQIYISSANTAPSQHSCKLRRAVLQIKSKENK